MYQGFELGDEAALPCGAVTALVEVVSAKVVVGLAGCEQVPGDHEDRVADCNRGPLRTASSADLGVLRSEVSRLSGAVPTSANAAHFVGIVEEHALRRCLI